MAGENDQEKTEEASQSRREDFRRKGQVAQTKELSTVLLLAFAAMATWVLGRFFLEQLLAVFNYSLGGEMVNAVRTGDLFSALRLAGEKGLIMVAPVFGIVFLLGIVSTFMQVGFLNTEDALSPNLNKLSPIAGFKRIFSLRQLVEGLKAVLKVSLVLLLVYLTLKSEILQLPMLSQASIEQMFQYLGWILLKLLSFAAILMAILAAADYFFQRWDLEKKMMMTKQEAKEEHKNVEGDPLVKARVRRIQREMANKRMMRDVPKADVIITNPTHIACALKYSENLPAPQLIAKGADLVAEKIKQIARENNIPIVENKPLARTMFKVMKIGQVIPRELFVAVAEVLAYVYKLKRKNRRS
ncbi:MAG: flagellar biosynthesis protein FlhB [Pseudobdellovibrionaceae bacterium]